MEIRLLHGAAIAPFITELGHLRLQILGEYPFLYDGTALGEADFLAGYPLCERSLLVLAQEHGQVVGASLGLPLSDMADALQEPFVARGQDPARVFYFAQSLVLPAYRGKAWACGFSSNANLMPTSWPTSISARSAVWSGRARTRCGPPTSSHWMGSGATAGFCVIPHCVQVGPGVIGVSSRRARRSCRFGSRHCCGDAHMPYSIRPAKLISIAP